MASIQIPNLPAVIGLDGSELFEGVQAGTSVKISLNQMIAATRSGLPTTLPIPVSLGGTGATTLTGYVKGNGTAPFTASPTIPNTDITGLGTMSTQNANAVAITGGTAALTGVSSVTVNSASAAFTVTQTGAGNAFLVEDSASDTTPFVIDASGNVGIGTSSPTSKLEVVGGVLANNFQVTNASSVTGAGIWGQGTTLAFNTNSTEKMRIDTSGNVGIGTTTPSAKLDVVGSAQLRANGSLLLLNSDNTNSYYIQNNGVTGYGNPVFDVIQGGVGTRMRIDASGNVGIGTISIADRLNVSTASGAAPSNNSGSNAIRVISTATAGVGVGPSILFEGQTGNATAQYGFAAIQGFKGSATAADYSGGMAFFIQPSGGASSLTERMRIDASGNVMVNTTAAIGKFVVAGNLSVLDAANAGYQMYMYSTNGVSYINAYQAGSQAIAFSTTLSGTDGERMRIDASGNVGIGTTTPSRTLSTAAINNILAVSGSVTLPYTVTGAEPLRIGAFANTNFAQGTSSVGNAVGLSVSNWNEAGDGATAIQAGVDAGNGGIELQARKTGAGVVSRLARFDIGASYFFTGNTERMRIGSSGGVGIGTTDTTSGKLNVAGGRTYLTTASGDSYILNLRNPAYTDGCFLGNPAENSFAVSNAAGTERMRIDASGNVGIGVTPSAWETGTAIQMAGGQGYSKYGVVNNAYYDGAAYRYIATATATLYGNSGGSHLWFNAASGTAGNAITFTQAMTLDASGNLGIGTTSPASKLAVVGGDTDNITFGLWNSSAYGSGNQLSRILLGKLESSTYQAMGIIQAAPDSNSSSNDGNLTFHTRNGGSTAERMRISSSGNITQANATSGNGAIVGAQTFRLAANVTAFGAAIGDFFGANSAISLEASSVYEITIYAVFTKTTAGTATWTLTASSAPTRIIGNYQGSPITGIAAGAPISGFTGSQGATTAAFAATGSLTTAVNHAYQFVVQVQTNAATNFRLQLTQSAGTATPLAGSYYTVKKISATTGTFVA